MISPPATTATQLLEGLVDVGDALVGGGPLCLGRVGAASSTRHCLWCPARARAPLTARGGGVGGMVPPPRLSPGGRSRPPQVATCRGLSPYCPATAHHHPDGARAGTVHVGRRVVAGRLSSSRVLRGSVPRQAREEPGHPRRWALLGEGAPWARTRQDCDAPPVERDELLRAGSLTGSWQTPPTPAQPGVNRRKVEAALSCLRAGGSQGVRAAVLMLEDALGDES